MTHKRKVCHANPTEPCSLHPWIDMGIDFSPVVAMTELGVYLYIKPGRKGISYIQEK